MWQTDCAWWRNGQNRVLRGGNWFNDERNMRSAYRNHNTADNRNDNIGLRLAGALRIGTTIGWSMAGGSVNQLPGNFAIAVLYKRCFGDKQQGTGCVSRQRVDARIAESLLRCRLFPLAWFRRSR